MADADPKKPIMDINKPGESTADATSRPIISSGKQITQDPMLSNDSKTQEQNAIEEKKDALAPSAQKKILKPLATTEDATQSTANTPKKEDTTSSEYNTSESSSEAEVDVLAGQVKTQKEKEAEKEAKQTQESKTAKLITEKTYFLPIKTPRNQRNVRTFMIIILLLAALGGAFYYAASTGVIPGIEL